MALLAVQIGILAVFAGAASGLIAPIALLFLGSLTPIVVGNGSAHTIVDVALYAFALVLATTHRTSRYVQLAAGK